MKKKEEKGDKNLPNPVVEEEQKEVSVEISNAKKSEAGADKITEDSKSPQDEEIDPVAVDAEKTGTESNSESGADGDELQILRNLIQAHREKKIPGNGVMGYLREAPGFGRSMAQLEGYAQGCGAAPEECDKVLITVMNILSGLAEGHISTSHFKLLLNALHHDRDVEMARSQGIVEGRNAQIVEEFRTGSGKRSGKDTENVPRFGTGASRQASRLGNSIFDLAREAY